MLLCKSVYTLPASQFVFYTLAGWHRTTALRFVGEWDSGYQATQTVAHQFAIIQIIIVMNLAHINVPCRLTVSVCLAGPA